MTEHVPNVRADEVSEVGGIDTPDVLRVDCRKVVVVLTSFLSTENSNVS